MKIGVLGTGAVGQSIATKLVELGHEVSMGSRSSANEKALVWASRHPHGATTATFEEATKFGDIIVLATKGDATLDILKLAGPKNFKGKTVMDISNPLDFSKGFPPFLTISNTDSLGEEVQNALPGAKVVKTLNTLTADLMTHPEKLPEETDIFMSGNSGEAKAAVKALLESFGWNRINDLGDITTARGTEQLLPLWVRLYSLYGNANFNFRIVKG